MFDESANISAKTWTRAIDSITKDGYSDGIVDGQTSSFQSSFDMGYAQGFQFGLELGFTSSQIKNEVTERQLSDQRRINCQMCINNTADKENIVNLFNLQKEKNDIYLKTLN